MTHELHYAWRERMVGREVRHCFFKGMCWHPSLALLMRDEFYGAGADTGPHCHEDFYALYVVKGGYGLHVIDDHPYTVTHGDVYMLLPGTTHAYRNFHHLTLEAFYFQSQLFMPDEQAALQGLSGFWRLLIMAAEEDEAGSAFRDHRLHLAPERYRELEPMLNEARAEFTCATPEAALLAHGLFFRLLIYLARQQMAQPGTRIRSLKDENGATSGKYTSYTIVDVLRFCEERFHEPLSVPQLADLMFLSPGRFSERFTREVGVSPAAYIRRLRLERAQTLLRTTERAVTSIAHDVGFSDGAQFSRAFQSMFGVSPTEYRAAQR